MSSQRRPGLRSLIEGTLATASLSGLLLVTVAATALAYSNAQRTHEHGAHAIHRTIRELATPALAISDYSEILRVLSLVSGGHELIAVITQNGDLLLPDYQRGKEVEGFMRIHPGDVQCSGLFKREARSHYQVLCTELGAGQGLYADRPLGVLVTADVVDFWPLLPTVLLPMIVIGVLGTMFVVIAFRQAFKRRVLRPFEALVRNIRDAIASPLAGDLRRLQGDAAPAELRLLEDAWIALMEAARRQHAEYHAMEKRRALYDLARQIAHDIRGPVLALKTQMEMSELEMSDKTRRRFSLAVARIQEIAAQLLVASQNGATPGVADAPEKREVFPLLLLTEELVAEKSTQYATRPGVKVSFDTTCCMQDAFAWVDTSEYKRVLSNLVDNAVEALGAAGTVAVTMECKEPNILVKIHDTGRGIPPEILPKLGRQGASFFKKGGTGLGLHHAHTRVKHWGGELSIDSNLGMGTTVTLSLPQRSPPSWLASPQLVEPGLLVVLDDDTVMHKAWRNWAAELSRRGKSANVKTFTAVDSLAEWLQGPEGTTSARFFVDLDLGVGNPTGLEVIQRLGIGSRSTLVTGATLTRDLIDRCTRQHLQILPKRWLEDMSMSRPQGALI